MEAEYEALITGSGQGALGLHFASGRRVYIPLKGDWADLCMLVQKCNRAGLDPAQVPEVLEDYGLSPEKSEWLFW
ncbi:MAG: hypothetical protein ACOYKJ_01180 [Candidatus Howiella sp.]